MTRFSCRFLFIFCVVLFFQVGCRDHHDIISIFPLEHYSQHLADWMNPTDANFDKPLLNKQTEQHQKTIFYKHTFGSSSPWEATYVNKIIHSADNISSIEQDVINIYNNQNKPDNQINYGENFRPYPLERINAIAKNIHVSQFNHLQYHAYNRAIAIDNLYVRALPTDDSFFYSYKIPGQGFPFDNLQISALWVGTPVYILGETDDHAWSLIIAPEYIGWVKSIGLARANDAFIQTWKQTAAKHLAAIIKTQTSIVDTEHTFRFLAYVGSYFPALEEGKYLKLLIPVADLHRQALIHYAILQNNQAVFIPFAPTPRHFWMLIETLLGRPYGWGNSYFYNDCSSEIKNLFTPFGVWLPRHSSEQMHPGKWIDLSAETTASRLHYLMQKAHPFTSLIYVGGHIILYIGNYPNPHATPRSLMPMTFQDMWGLSPHPPTRRAVIGQSVLFPLLEHYPEDPHLISQASKKIFQISDLDERPDKLIELEVIDLKQLMCP